MAINVMKLREVLEMEEEQDKEFMIAAEQRLIAMKQQLELDEERYKLAVSTSSIG